jgi:CysZ protein
MSIGGRDEGFGGVFRGIALLTEGVGFLRKHRGLWPLASVPTALATLAVGVAGVLFWVELGAVHAIFVEAMPSVEPGAWWSWLWVAPARALFFVLSWLGVLVCFALSLLAALLVASLLSAPFLDVLSQKVEYIVNGETHESGLSPLREALRSFLSELQRIAFMGAIWLTLTLVGFVLPGAHLLTAPLLVAATIVFLPLDYAGFALDRRGVSFAARRAWLGARLPLMLGFGGVAFVACMIPGLNLVLMPSLVTAGTLLVLRAGPTAD